MSSACSHKIVWRRYTIACVTYNTKNERGRLLVTVCRLIGIAMAREATEAKIKYFILEFGSQPGTHAEEYEEIQATFQQIHRE